MGEAVRPSSREFLKHRTAVGHDEVLVKDNGLVISGLRRLQRDFGGKEGTRRYCATFAPYQHVQHGDNGYKAVVAWRQERRQP